jgi:type VI secretion system protein ImpF
MPPAIRINPSLFDRLTDYEPRRTREVAPPESEQRDLYESGVARDLADLLNTVRRADEIPEEYVLARESVLAYGVPDFTSAPRDPESIRSVIESVVRTFEPRLSHVAVTPGPALGASPQSGKSDVAFQFRISGVLRTDIGSELVVFDAVLPRQQCRFQVTVGR